MSLHAFDDIDDAMDATRAFLLPFAFGRWARLAVVVLFLGGTGFNLPLGGFDVPTGDTGTPPPGEAPELTNAVLLAIGAVVAVLLLLGLAYLFVGSVMEFVFVRSLATESVHVRRYWSENLGRGLRLFGFRAGLGLLALVVLGGMVVLALFPLLAGGGAAVSVLFVLALAPVFVLGAIAFGLVNGFTTAFVVPVMLREERGVLDAWRRLWPTVRGAWKEYAVYAVVSWAFALGLGIAVGVAVGIAAIVLLVPALVVGLLGVALLAVLPPAGLLVLVVTGLVYVLGLVAAFALAQVAVQTFLRYYALFVLGDTTEYDLVAAVRADVRGSGADRDDGGGGDNGDGGEDGDDGPDGALDPPGTA